jgi:hypothetical protein
MAEIREKLREEEVEVEDGPESGEEGSGILLYIHPTGLFSTCLVKFY